MGRSRVVVPEVVRVPLSEGDYIDCKRELNAGEYYDLLVALGDRQKFAKILAYVVGWSLVGLDDQPIPYDIDDPEPARRDTIGALDKRTLRELITALDQHEATQDQRLAKKKDDPAWDGWRARVRSDLNVCRAMGWTYDDVRALPREVYTVLIEMLNQKDPQ